MKRLAIALGLSGAAALLASGAHAASYTYDTLGRVATVTADNGLITTYCYDAAGNRGSVTTSSTQGSCSGQQNMSMVQTGGASTAAAASSASSAPSPATYPPQPTPLPNPAPPSH